MTSKTLACPKCQGRGYTFDGPHGDVFVEICPCAEAAKAEPPLRQGQHQTARVRAAHYKGVRACVEWLHFRARLMSDPHARRVLNSAAFDLGRDKPAPAGLLDAADQNNQRQAGARSATEPTVQDGAE